MASIFKRSKKKNTPYLIQYKDCSGKRITVKGFTDKGLTEQLAGKLESETRLRSMGLIDPMQDRLAVQKQVLIAVHVSKFEESRGKSTNKYIQLMLGRIRRIIAGGEFKTLAEIDGEAVQSYLRKLQKAEDLGHRTYNHYVQAFDTFCNWCVTTKRLSSNPVLGLERLNTAVDVRHPRRALSAEELTRLVASARQSNKRIQGFSGEQRARIYLISYMTGLRKKEIASLTPLCFALVRAPPTVTVEAACSKHRRKDVLPLHPELVVALRQWVAGMSPGQKLFPDLDRKKTWLMVRKDLERVGIAYETEDGFADFHAAGRHTHITELLRNGASLPEAKELARHSDVNMTMRYTHIGLKDQAKALGNLPAQALYPPTTPTPTSDPSTQAALQMRSIPGVPEEQSVSLTGKSDTTQKRHNPCWGKGYVNDQRQLAVTDNMEAAGIEPASRDVSMEASTRVVNSLIVDALTPVDRVRCDQPGA